MKMTGSVKVRLAVMAVLVGTAGAQAAQNSYFCYKASQVKGEPKFTVAPTVIKDVFNPAGVTLDAKKIEGICNPLTGAPNATVHQSDLQVKSQKGAPKFVKVNVAVTTTLGADTNVQPYNLTTTGYSNLLDVTPKVLGTTPPAPFGVDPTVGNANVNRFNCYKVSPTKGSPKFVAITNQVLSDEFPAGINYDLKKITKVCAPANVNSGTPGAEARAARLLCYQAKAIKGAPKFSKPIVSIADANFPDPTYANALTATASNELCVPTAGPAPSKMLLLTSAGGGVCGHSTDAAGGGGTTLKSLSCGGLDLGGAGTVTPVPESITPSGSTGEYALSGCAGGGDTCTVSAVTSGSQGAGHECTDTGCKFGTPLPIPNGNVSVCVENIFASPSTGTVNTGSGAANVNTNLNSHTIITGNIVVGATPQPCPVCSGGLCTTGPNHGLACTSTNPDGLTNDCPPGGKTCRSGVNGGKFCVANSDCPTSTCQPSTDLGNIPVNLSPYSTGALNTNTVVLGGTSNAAGNFCPGQDLTTHQGCFAAATCQYFDETGIPAGPLSVGGSPTAITLVSLFCIPATGNILVDDASTGLPGPGATAVPYSVSIQ